MRLIVAATSLLPVPLARLAGQRVKYAGDHVVAPHLQTIVKCKYVVHISQEYKLS